jgi:ATP-dependent Clp protease ATP-binding subunit ClpA
MPPNINNFTTKAKEAIKKAHELAIERGQNHVNSVHLLTALILQEESMVMSILERLEVDTILLSDSLIEAIEGPESRASATPSYQIFLTPDFAQVLENSVRIAHGLKDEFVSTEHLLVAILEVPSEARELISRFKVSKEAVIKIIQEFRSENIAETHTPKKMRMLTKYTRNLTKLAKEDKLDPVIGRDTEIMRIMQILSRRTKNNPILIGEPGTGGNVMLRRDALKSIGGIDTSIAFYGDDTNLGRRLSKVGRVRFCTRFVCYTSGRRLTHGFLSTSLKYILNYLSEAFLHRPVTKRYDDIR